LDIVFITLYSKYRISKFEDEVDIACAGGDGCYGYGFSCCCKNCGDHRVDMGNDLINMVHHRLA
jgi:hypothetical protein